MNEFLFWVLLPYDALFGLPYTWIKVCLGIATGFFIRKRIVGLLACVLGNGFVFAYARPADSGKLPTDMMAFLIVSIFVLIGVVWWAVGRIMRGAFDKICARWLPAKSDSSAAP